MCNTEIIALESAREVRAGQLIKQLGNSGKVASINLVVLPSQNVNIALHETALKDSDIVKIHGNMLEALKRSLSEIQQEAFQKMNDAFNEENGD